MVADNNVAQWVRERVHAAAPASIVFGAVNTNTHPGARQMAANTVSHRPRLIGLVWRALQTYRDPSEAQYGLPTTLDLAQPDPALTGIEELVRAVEDEFTKNPLYWWHHKAAELESEWTAKYAALECWYTNPTTGEPGQLAYTAEAGATWTAEEDYADLYTAYKQCLLSEHPQ